MIKHIKWTSLCYWALLTLVSIWPALYNQFPLVTPDSGAYIHSGIKLSMGVDRQWGYGIYLLLSTWGISLWGAVLLQGLIFSWLVHELCLRIMPDKASPSVVGAITVLIAFGTSAAWFSSQLMADAFTGLLLIAMLLLFLGGMSKRKTWLLSAFIFFCLMMHSSHIVVTLLSSIILMVFFYRKKMPALVSVARKLSIMSVTAILLTCTAYAIGGYGFRFNPVSHMFLMSRMAENGILDEYLDEHCPVENLSLCDSRGNTGDRQWVFMWMGKYPHSVENGWITTRKEYNKIIYGSLSSPKYLGLHILKNTEAGLRQLSQLYTGDGIDQKNPQGSSPYNTIEKEFGHELKEFRSSVQNSGQLPLVPVNVIIISFAVIAGILSLYLWKKQPDTGTQPQTNWSLIFGVVILFIVLNAFVTATFSTVIARLQARVFWVLPLICVLYVYDVLAKNKQTRIS